jgi:hypothetical protein
MIPITLSPSSITGIPLKLPNTNCDAISLAEALFFVEITGVFMTSFAFSFVISTFYPSLVLSIIL